MFLYYYIIFSSLSVGLFANARFSPTLKSSKLLQKPSSNLILTLRNLVDPILEQIASKNFSNREQRLLEVYTKVNEAIEKWQAPVLERLKEFNVTTKCFWATNQIYVKNANPSVIRALQGVPALQEIAEEVIHPLIPNISPKASTQSNGTEWGVRRIGAEEVWRYTRGEGVRIAIIDIGVRATHTILRENFIGTENNGWFDPILSLPFPTDNIGHGTHCAGIICGKNGTGVAPEAKWLACRACDTIGCPESALLECGQWVICPTDPQGQSPNCSNAPHIVSNSWGGNGGETWFNNVIKAWNAAGIIGVFAIGNDGPACNTDESPGDQPGVISVGSTNITDTVSYFSSRGPNKSSNDSQVAPLIVAPGHDINSASNISDNAYQTMSGTSMATPHVSGSVALLLSENPNLNLEDIMQLLLSTANRNLEPTGTTCGNTTEDVYPNEIAGYGRLDISYAFDLITNY